MNINREIEEECDTFQLGRRLERWWGQTSGSDLLPAVCSETPPFVICHLD